MVQNEVPNNLHNHYLDIGIFHAHFVVGWEVVHAHFVICWAVIVVFALVHIVVVFQIRFVHEAKGKEGRH